MNPVVHSQSSVRKWGGTVDEYIHLHEKMDCSKKYLADSRHRALTHHMFWVNEVMIPIFGHYITLSTGKLVSVKDICERHIQEDYSMRFIPTAQDFLQELELKDWMLNGKGELPSSCKKIFKSKKE